MDNNTETILKTAQILTWAIIILESNYETILKENKYWV